MIGERVKMLRETLGQNQTKFSERGGFSQGFLSAVEKEQKVPGAAFLQSLRRYFDANVNWILTGEGEMFDGAMPALEHPPDRPEGLEEDEWQLICNYRCASDEMRKACFGNLEMSAKESRGKDGGGSNSKEMKSA
jgi:transcriptional regulator with XRE-family HTH domain